MRPYIIGHRGYPAKYPENTIASFLAALYYGADGVEFDVRLTQDGIPVVIHDADTRRIAGVGCEVKKTSLIKLKKLHLGLAQNIPTLEEVCKALPAKIMLLVEIKNVEAVEPALEIVKKYGRLNNTIIVSFMPEALSKAKKYIPGVKTGLNIVSAEKIQFGLTEWKDIGLSTLNPSIDSLKMVDVNLFKIFLKHAGLQGFETFIWTVNNPESIKGFIDLINGVITDEVELFVKAYEGK